ncbi:MAG TPA: TATA-box-binding protein, partial [Candidatus Aenigmarchaeota archaeon]|nr:TATA-box-binding protein [Candidatus Aenigmarchaeota archaeon]HEX32807.1 TATA-box-binding protein [Candidatus Aenigmarchaeota archaeon]
MASTKIENIVISASLHKEIPLEKAARRLPNTEYNPEQFPGLVLRLNEKKGERVTALIFASGNIVLTGTKSEDEVQKAVNMVVKELKKIGIKITKRPTWRVENMVASGSLGMKLNLNKLAFKLETAE